MADYETAMKRYKDAQSRLDRRTRALNDPSKFYPQIKCEWDRAFDARDKACFAAQAADLRRFAADHPQFIWAQTHAEAA